MCNLYSVYSTQATMRKTFGVTRDKAGNLPPLPGIFPDQMAPIVRLADGESELLQMRWGFPPLPRRLATIRLRTCAMWPRRSGARGSSRNIAAWCR
jgi:putative SOS response-associated peptidase YedK